MIIEFKYKDKEIILVGTAHISKESADLVTDVIGDKKPDTVCVELCDSRYQAITQKEKWQETDIVQVCADAAYMWRDTYAT